MRKIGAAIVFAMVTVSAAHVDAVPVTYDIVPGTDLTGFFTVDVETQTVTDYALGSIAEPRAFFVPNPLIATDAAFGANMFMFFKDFAQVGFQCVEHVGDCWRIDFSAELANLTFVALIMIEPLCCPIIPDGSSPSTTPSVPSPCAPPSSPSPPRGY